MPTRPLLVALLALLAPACGSSPPPATAASVVSSGDQIECPAPIGAVPREDCAAVADDFSALSVADSLKLAGTGHDAEARIEAIRSAAGLANSLKEQRVALCDAYDKCKVPPAEHADKDKLLAGTMRALIDLWNKRRFSRVDDSARFREAVRALDRKVNGDADAALAASAPKHLRAEQALGSVDGAGLAFKTEGGAITVIAQGAGSRPVLKGRGEAMPLVSGHHYRIKVDGSYAPAAAPAIAPGDELTVRLKVRAAQAVDLYAALRSLEDPEAGESTTTWPLKAGEQGAREATVTADPGSSGFYVGVGLRGAGSADLDDVEILRGGKVIAAARAEVDGEPGVKSDCLVVGDRPLGGKRSLRCKADAGDRLTLGAPSAYLFLALRAPLGELAVVKTLSLEGGRSVDATVSEDTELIVGLVGAGTATIRSVEVGEIVGGAVSGAVK